jgi:hypothetical protein
MQQIGWSRSSFTISGRDRLSHHTCLPSLLLVVAGRFSLKNWGGSIGHIKRSSNPARTFSREMMSECLDSGIMTSK